MIYVAMATIDIIFIVIGIIAYIIEEIRGGSGNIILIGIMPISLLLAYNIFMCFSA